MGKRRGARIDRRWRMTISNARVFPVSFGRHAGKTIEEIGREDMNYVRWLSENQQAPYFVREAAGAFAQACDEGRVDPAKVVRRRRKKAAPEPVSASKGRLARYEDFRRKMTPEAAAAFPLHFGKHSGKTIGEVGAESPAYLEWMVEQDGMIPRARAAAAIWLESRQPKPPVRMDLFVEPEPEPAPPESDPDIPGPAESADRELAAQAKSLALAMREDREAGTLTGRESELLDFLARVEERLAARWAAPWEPQDDAVSTEC